jgi:hypothetical protein
MSVAAAVPWSLHAGPPPNRRARPDSPPRAGPADSPQLPPRAGRTASAAGTADPSTEAPVRPRRHPDRAPQDRDSPRRTSRTDDCLHAASLQHRGCGGPARPGLRHDAEGIHRNLSAGLPSLRALHLHDDLVTEHAEAQDTPPESANPLQDPWTAHQPRQGNGAQRQARPLQDPDDRGRATATATRDRLRPSAHDPLRQAITARPTPAQRHPRATSASARRRPDRPGRSG